MDILRVAFKFSPNETARIMSKIYKEDSKISKLSRKLKIKFNFQLFFYYLSNIFCHNIEANFAYEKQK